MYHYILLLPLPLLLLGDAIAYPGGEALTHDTTHPANAQPEPTIHQTNPCVWSPISVACSQHCYYQS